MQCPLEFIKSDEWEIIQYAKLYEKGLPPIAGGALDQSKCFLDAAGFIFNEFEYWKKKLGL